MTDAVAPVLTGGPAEEAKAPAAQPAQAQALDRPAVQRLPALYAKHHGPDLFRPKITEMLAPGRWVPEALLVQVAGPLIDLRRAGIAYRRLRRKAHKKLVPGISDVEANRLAAQDYYTNGSLRSDAQGRRWIIINDVLQARVNRKRWEWRIIAEGRLAGQREWRLRPAYVEAELLRSQRQAELTQEDAQGRPHRGRRYALPPLRPPRKTGRKTTTPEDERLFAEAALAGKRKDNQSWPAMMEANKTLPGGKLEIRVAQELATATTARLGIKRGRRPKAKALPPAPAPALCPACGQPWPEGRPAPILEPCPSANAGPAPPEPPP